MTTLTPLQVQALLQIQASINEIREALKPLMGVNERVDIALVHAALADKWADAILES